jgi:Mor family transcriptional regulator
VVRLFTHDGSTYFLWREILVQAITPSATIASYFFQIDCSMRGNALYLPASHSIRASTHNAETFKVHVFGSDL